MKVRNIPDTYPLPGAGVVVRCSRIAYAHAKHKDCGSKPLKYSSWHHSQRSAPMFEYELANGGVEGIRSFVCRIYSGFRVRISNLYEDWGKGIQSERYI